MKYLGVSAEIYGASGEGRPSYSEWLLGPSLTILRIFWDWQVTISVQELMANE